MTTPTARCYGIQAPCLLNYQKQQAYDQSLCPSPPPQMATGNVNSVWPVTHNVANNDEASNIGWNNPPHLSWRSSPDPTAMAMQSSNYQLDPVSSYMDNTTYHDLPGWQIHPQHSFFLSSGDDPGCPRTFPAMEALGATDTMLSPYSAATIAPQEIYQHGPPRSEPYSYMENQETYNQQHSICESVEAESSTPRDGFRIYPDDNTSYRSFSCSEPVSTGEDLDQVEQKPEPYAGSLFRCLKEAPNNTMVLREIYDWYKENTLKGKEPHEKGWQNSIRHNLSMNKAFEKIEVASPGDSNKKGFQWRLSAQALRDGRVHATTRYRNKQPNKRGSKSHNPAPHRQASGAKGGRMARFAAESRRSQRIRDSHNLRSRMSHRLRSRGIIGNGMTVLSQSPGTRRNSPSDMDYMGHEAYQSDASSPYHLLDDGIYSTYQSPHYEPAFPTNHPTELSLALQHQQETYGSSPDRVASTPEIHWHAVGDRIFYDGSEPNSQPMTPTSFHEPFTMEGY